MPRSVTRDTCVCGVCVSTVMRVRVVALVGRSCACVCVVIGNCGVDSAVDGRDITTISYGAVCNRSGACASCNDIVTFCASQLTLWTGCENYYAASLLLNSQVVRFDSVGSSQNQVAKPGCKTRLKKPGSKICNSMSFKHM